LKPKIVIARYKAWDLLNYQEPVICAMLDKGYEVVAVATPDACVARLEALGCRFIPLNMHNQSTHPLRDLVVLWKYVCLMLREKPLVFLGYTVKPNIYGSLAARLAGAKIINNINGLGTAFLHNNWLARLVTLLYRLALASSSKVLFHNQDDRELFVRSAIVRDENTGLLPGSGVNLTRFSLQPMPSLVQWNGLRFLFVGRMLWDKGVLELVEAVGNVKHKYQQTVCCLLGAVDERHPSGIPKARIQAWCEQGLVTYQPHVEDVRTEMIKADCVVHPSYYREGLPKSLLEAAALGRPVITTDSVGCRDVVEDGVTGYLCKPRDAEDLALKLLAFIELSPEQRSAMGRAGRAKAEREFDEQIIVRNYLELLSTLV